MVFPGQGSQSDDMRELVESFAPDVLEALVAAVGEDPFTRLSDGTRYVQPAIFCCSIASWRSVRDELSPIAFAGHSLGELAALVAADAIDLEDGVRLVAARARLTAAAAQAGEGMLAVMGLTADVIRDLAERHSTHVANYNSPRQQVLAGEHGALEGAGEEVRSLGGSTVVLEITGAFHSPAMREAARAFRDELEDVEVDEGSAPVFCGATARPFEDVRAQLASSLTEPVLWEEVVRNVRALGVERFLEAAPGKVLSGLIKRIDGTVEIKRFGQLLAAGTGA